MELSSTIIVNTSWRQWSLKGTSSEEDLKAWTLAVRYTYWKHMDCKFVLQLDTKLKGSSLFIDECNAARA